MKPVALSQYAPRSLPASPPPLANNAPHTRCRLQVARVQGWTRRCAGAAGLNAATVCSRRIIIRTVVATSTARRRKSAVVASHVSGKGCYEGKSNSFISRLTQSIRIFLLHKHRCNGLPVALLRRARVRAAVQHAQALGPGVYPAGVQHRREAAAAQPLKPLTNEQHLLG